MHHNNNFNGEREVGVDREQSNRNCAMNQQTGKGDRSHLININNACMCIKNRKQKQRSLKKGSAHCGFDCCFYIFYVVDPVWLLVLLCVRVCIECTNKMHCNRVVKCTAAQCNARPVMEILITV